MNFINSKFCNAAKIDFSVKASKQETCSEKGETKINQDKTCNSINCKTYIYTKVHLSMKMIIFNKKTHQHLQKIRVASYLRQVFDRLGIHS